MMFVLRHVFSHPWMLSALLALPVLAILAWRAGQRRRKVFAQFGHWPSVQAMVAGRKRFRWMRFLCLFWGMIALAVASAGPQWGRELSQATAPGRDLVVVLDVSRSMQAEQPSRLSRAQAALVDLVDSLRQRGGNRIGLVVFAGQTKVLCPLTHDYDHFREMLDNIDAEQLSSELRPTGDSPSGTRIGAGLLEAAALMDVRNQGAQDILLVSDGDDPVPDNEWLLGANVCAAREIPVHTVAVGDPDVDSPIPGVSDKDGKPVRSRLTEKPLQEIAQRTGGFYEPARTHVAHLGKRYRDEIKKRPTREDTEDALPIYQGHSFMFFGAALGLLAFEMVLAGWSKRKRKMEEQTESIGLSLHSAA